MMTAFLGNSIVNEPAGTAPLVRKLESIFSISPEERTALDALPIQVAKFGAHEDIVRVGERASRCVFVQDGFACSYKITGAGDREILNFHVPGDMPDLQSLHLDVVVIVTEWDA
jgi:CRP-like cAMP-binding protein